MSATTMISAPATAELRRCPGCDGPAVEGRPLVEAREGARLVRCGNCRLVYWTDHWPAPRAREHYERYYQPTAVAFDELTSRRYEALLDRLAGLTGVGRLLDVGAGAGQLVAVAEERGWESTALEISASGLACLRGLRASRGMRFTILEEELGEAGVEAGRFGVVTLIEVLEHVTDPAGLLRECCRVLRPGGVAYLTTPNYDSLSRRLLGARWRVIADEHRCLFTPSTLRGLVTRTGLRCLALSTRNLDLAHLLQAWRGGSSGAHPAVAESASQALRHQVEAVGWLRVLKGAVNGALRMYGLGDTIELLAVK